MWKQISRWLGKEPSPQAATNERLLDLERKVRSLQLDLGEKEKAVDSLERQVERHHEREVQRIAEAVEANMERLFTDVASPVTQLLTQVHLLEVEDKPVQAKDVLAVAKRLIGRLEDSGFAVEEAVGEKVSFDPDRHQSMSTSASPALEGRVVVRFVGVSYRGKIIKKAGVEPCPED